jgi:hypothetical protein
MPKASATKQACWPPAPPKHEPKTFTFNVKAAEFVPQKLLEVQPQPRYVPKPPRRKDVYIETVQLPSGQLVQLKDTIRNYDHEKYLKSKVPKKYPSTTKEIAYEDLDEEFKSELSGEALRLDIEQNCLKKVLEVRNTSPKQPSSAALAAIDKYKTK